LETVPVLVVFDAATNYSTGVGAVGQVKGAAGEHESTSCRVGQVESPGADCSVGNRAKNRIEDSAIDRDAAAGGIGRGRDVIARQVGPKKEGATRAHHPAIDLSTAKGRHGPAARCRTAEIIPLPWITPCSVALPLTETPATFSTPSAVTIVPLSVAPMSTFSVAPKPDTTVPIALPGRRA
jgi:hypothetical protein